MKNVVNDLVGYNDLKIVQNNKYFNFSLESVILPRFCNINSSTKNIIDFCTGNAPIPLILSTLTNSNIIGVELQKEIYELANESIKMNNLSDRIKILNLDVKDLTKFYSTDSFDLITCNPPYFKIEKDGKINENMIKSIARHELCININDICVVAKKLLKNNSSLVMVHRTERLTDVILALKNNNLEPKRLRFIYPKYGEKSNLFLIDAKKNGNVGLTVLPPLVCHNSDGTYTNEILEMFKRCKYDSKKL